MVCKFDANIWDVIHFDFDNFIIHINKNVLDFLPYTLYKMWDGCVCVCVENITSH